VGSGLDDGLGVADGDSVAVGVTVGVADADSVAVRVTVGVAEGDADLLADRLGLALGEPLPVVPDEVATVGEVGLAGENEEDGAAKGLDPAQAETATEASMVMLLQPMAANFALSPVPAMDVRTFIEPPRASRPVGPFPGPGTRNRHRKESAWWPAAAYAERRAIP
jgi:hypothetical protein